MTVTIFIALVALVAIVAWEIRRAPKRRAERAEERALDADANSALKAISKLARERAKSMSIPVPVMGHEDTTDVIVLHEHRRSGDQQTHAHKRREERRTPKPGEYAIVSQRLKQR